MHDPSASVTSRGPSETEVTPDWVDLFSAAADTRRLAILATLRGAGRLPIEELSARVADREPGPEGGGDVTPATLYHVHLPKLAEAGLVEVTEDADGAAVAPGPAFEAGAVEALERAVDSDPVDEATVSALEEPRRRRAISVLSAVGGSISLDDLAAAISAGGATPSGEPTPDVAVTLHHVDLPKLAAADLVDYEPEAGLVTYRGLPDELSVVVAGR